MKKWASMGWTSSTAGVGRTFQALSCVVGLVMLTGCSDEALYSDLSERQANQIQVALVERDIQARKRRSDDGSLWQVRVNRSDMPEALRVLGSRGLPRTEYRDMGQIFERRGFVSSPLEERARFQFAVAQQLSHTFSRIDGVIEAHVQVAMPERDRLSTNTVEPSASVVLIVEPDFRSEEVEARIRAIVTDAVEDLDNVDRVTVATFPRALPEPVARRQQDDGILPASFPVSITLPTLLVLAGLILFIGVIFMVIRGIRRSRRAEETMV